MGSGFIEGVLMRLHLGGHLNWYEPHRRSWLDLSLPKTLSLVELVHRLGLPREEIAIVVVNGQTVSLENAQVSNGDQVELYPPLGGGAGRMTLPPGTLLHQRYEIVEVIGGGGMGRVYLALDRHLEGRRCAVKEIRTPPDATPEMVEAARRQFRQEAHALAQLDHPNLPKVYDFFAAGGRDYLVMEYVAGQDLRSILEDTRQRGRFLPESQVLRWAEQLCDALSYLHNQTPPVLHRDVKPANVKLTPAGLIKLVDFGLVCTLQPEELQTVTVMRGVGSLPYTPLEQYSAELSHADIRSDIYALAATLYHLLTGQAPPTAQALFLQPQLLIPPMEINPAISPQVEHAILQAMSPHPRDRPPSIEAFRRALLAQPAPPPMDWLEIARANLLLILLALALLAWAVVLTFR